MLYVPVLVWFQVLIRGAKTAVLMKRVVVLVHVARSQAFAPTEKGESAATLLRVAGVLGGVAVQRGTIVVILDKSTIVIGIRMW